MIGEEKTNLLRLRRMGLRNCKVSCRDLSGIEHTVEVSADSLYEAVAQALRAFRESGWVGDLARGQFTISVIVKNPESSTAFECKISNVGSTLRDGHPLTRALRADCGNYWS